MFSHVMIGSNDIARSRKFYDGLFAVLGAEPVVVDAKGRLLYEHSGGLLMISKPLDGNPATPANGGTIGFWMRDPHRPMNGIRQESSNTSPISEIQTETSYAASTSLRPKTTTERRRCLHTYRKRHLTEWVTPEGGRQPTGLMASRKHWENWTGGIGDLPVSLNFCQRPHLARAYSKTPFQIYRITSGSF